MDPAGRVHAGEGPGERTHPPRWPADRRWAASAPSGAHCIASQPRRGSTSRTGTIPSSRHRDAHAGLVQELGAIAVRTMVDLERDATQKLPILRFVHRGRPPAPDLAKQTERHLEADGRDPDGRVARLARGPSPEGLAPAGMAFPRAGPVDVARQNLLDERERSRNVAAALEEVRAHHERGRRAGPRERRDGHARLAAIHERQGDGHEQGLRQGDDRVPRQEAMNRAPFVRAAPELGERTKSLLQRGPGGGANADQVFDRIAHEALTPRSVS